MNDFQYIKNEALGLEIDATRQVLCPFCGDDEGKLSITRIEEGILYNCYRASCDARGFLGSIPSALLPKSKRRTFTPKSFTRPTSSITGDWLLWLCAKYGLKESTIASNGWKKLATGHQGLLMPLFNRMGYVYGHTTKHFRKEHKACHYLQTEQPMLSYAMPIGGSVAVLVEDIISAAKVNQLADHLQGIALLGTDVNDEKIQDILKAGYNSVIIALDPDARAKAFTIQKKYALFFQRTNVVSLPADPKDMTNEELLERLS